VIHFWGGGAVFYSFTAFFNPIVDEFGWSYAATSLAASLRTIEGGIASPLVGFAADRYGARKLIFFGSILTGFAFIILSQIKSLWTFYSAFLALSIASSVLLPIPGWTAVANWFSTKRGTALGFLSAAVGVSGVMIYVVNWLIEIYGWRTTLIIIGIGMWVVGIPSSLVVRNRPEPYGLAPDGERSSEPLSRPVDSAQNKSYAEHSRDFRVQQALKTKAFWLITGPFFIAMATIHGVIVHVMPCLISVGFDREMASLVAALVVFVSTAGRFGFGWLGDWMNKRYLLAFALLLQALGVLMLANVQSVWEAIIFIALFGPAYGGVVTLRLTIPAAYFGGRAFGAIQGAMMTVMVIGTTAGPLLTGMVYDLCASYYLVWIVMAVAILGSIPLALKAHAPHGEK